MAFYEDDEGIVQALIQFVGAGLAAGAPLVVVVTEAQATLMRRKLEGGAVDLARAVASGQLVVLPSPSTLASISESGSVSRERFERVVVPVVKETQARRPDVPLRVFGGMVDLLWARGDADGGILLEELWNELRRTEVLTLHCAYTLAHVREASDRAVICGMHAEGRAPAGVEPGSEPAQQRSKRLEAEIERRTALERQLREQIRINETLARISTVLTSELDHDRLVQKITDSATTLCRAQFGAFFHNFIDDNGESYTLYTLSGAPREAFSRFPLPRNTAVFGPTFDGTAIVRSDDITQDPRYGKNAPRHGMQEGHLPVRSYLAVPVRSRTGKVIGGLFFGHADRAVFTETDERTMVGVAAQAGIAMDNANLFRAVHHAEASSAGEREKLRGLFMQSPALIVIMRGPDHVYDFVNEAAAQVLGRDDALGKPVRDLLPHLPASRLVQLDEVYRTGERWLGEAVPSIRDWRGDGVPYARYFNMVWEPYRRADGSVEGVMSFGFEVTDQVLAAQRLEAIAVELETANRMKDEFLATVSHELRTPLNAMLGWVRMVRSGSLPPDKVERALATIERNANAQTQLIEDLLDVNRIISGKLRLEVSTVDLPVVIENALEAVRPAAQAKSVVLRQTIDPGAAPILGDSDRLQQVVWNLLTNAVKFTQKGGHVHVVVRKRDSSVDVIVTDDGAGIEKEFLSLVFERFRQVDATTSRKHGGLGLGLAIVRHLVELHGGTVHVASEGLGKGSSFTVSLPISPVRSAALDRPPALRAGRPTGPFDRPPALEGVHVLVVDDEPDARELLAEMLGACKAQVTRASSAAEALERVRAMRPDVIVSDIGMPDEDGYGFVRKLRALPKSEGGRTPAVALTAYARLEDRTKALMAGFNMHVPKPVEPSELLAVLASLVSMFGRD